MQREEAAWRQAIEDEEAASAAVVAAERDLQQLLQHHLASSPTVDNAVSELALRRSEYSLTLRTTYEAAALYHRTEWDVILAESHRRREDHEQRVRAVRQQTPPGRQQAVTTSGLGVAHSRSSSSENGSPPRPTKRLNFGRSSCTPAAQTSKSEQSEQRDQSEDSKQSEQSEESEQSEPSEESEESKQNEQSEQSEQMKQSEQREQSEQTEQTEQSEQSEQSEQTEQCELGSGDSENGSSSGDDGGCSSIRSASDASINRLMPLYLYDPKVHGVPPRMHAPAPVQARRTDYVSD
jgi:hypothetical protein